MDSGPQFPPTGMELNQEIFPIFIRKLTMDCGPHYPLSGLELWDMNQKEKNAFVAIIRIDST